MINLEPDRQLQNFNPNEALIPNPDPEQQANPTYTWTLESPVHITPESFGLQRDEENPSLYSLVFNFDSLNSGVIIVYSMATEVVNNENCYQILHHDNQGIKNPIGYKVKKGFNQVFPPKIVELNIQSYDESMLLFQDREHFPLVVEFKSEEYPNYAEISYLCFQQLPNGYSIHTIKQVLVAEGKRFKICELYGINKGSEDDQEIVECVICMTNLRDTMVLPCKHMCLCEYCANIMRSQPNSKCPICRTMVEKYLQIVVN